MCKKTNILFFLIALFVCTSTYAQINPFYTVTQKNIRSDYFNNFEVVNHINIGNTYDPVYPAYTSFMIDGYELENIPSSKHIQGLPIGFKFPYADQEFDIFALNVKGYIVLGKSWEGGMTVYADTLIESATDTVFTDKNKYLISGLYTGKNMDHTGNIYIYINKGGFEGERRLYISLLNRKVLRSGLVVYIYNDFELKETGEINIKPYVQSNNAGFTSYGAIIQRDGTGKDNYLYGVGDHADAWFQTQQTYTADTDFKYGIFRDTILPLSVNQQTYTINYQPVNSSFNETVK